MAFNFFNKCPKCKNGFFWMEDSDWSKEGCIGECSNIDLNCEVCSLHGE